MNPFDTLVGIGRITKKWGFGLEVMISLKEGESWPAKIKEPVFIRIADKPVPFFVEASKLQGKKGVVASFHDMSEFLLNSILHCEVYRSASNGKTTHSTETHQPLSGYIVMDKTMGEIGIADHLMEREIQPVLVVKQDELEILIPYTAEIITKTDHKKRRILIEAPEGLIDLYLNP